MSEAILYAMDAPGVSDLASAVALVEGRGASDGAPTARISAFFGEILQTWPEDGRNGNVWYEDFTHNQPSGNVLEMAFDLDGFTEESLVTLRALAERHGLHVLDAEGEVLYLSDGNEVTP